MPIEHATKHLTWNTVEDYLGPAEQRFFGAGYRRVIHRFHEERAEGAGALVSRASIQCPPDWSRKGSIDQRPHLSTVDVLVIAPQFAELLILRSFNLSDAERSRMWLRHVIIHAGKAPVEDSLDDLPVTARITRTDPPSVDGGDAVTQVMVKVATLTLQLQIAHQPGDGAGPGPRPTMADLLGPVENRLYGDGFRNQRVAIRHLTVDPATSIASASATVVQEAAATLPGRGMEAAYQPSTSLMIAFVEALQIGQILLYELDSVDRAHSDTLWMRRTVIEATTPLRATGDPDPVTVALKGAQILVSGEHTWRVADISAVRPGITVTCSVAHRLNSAAQRENRVTP